MPGRRGFTLVELLVVVAIVSVLVGLAVPAVLRARQAAARAECQSNLRQIGVAIEGHAAARRTFPFASGRPRPGSVEHLDGRPEDGAGWVRPQSWAMSILPYMEETVLARMYEEYCLACPPEAQEAEIVAAHVRVYNSWSRAAGAVDFSALVGPGPAAADPARRLDRWYFAGTVSADAFGGTLVPEGLGFVAASGTYTVPVRSQPVRPAEVTDGLSCTLVLAECGDYSTDDGGTWLPPRYSWPYVSDVARYTGRGAGPGATALEASTKPRSRGGDGVFQALAGDGSVRTLAENVADGVLTALATRGGGEQSPASARP
jgi:prepilin-type N-terminal cleavage/methylation domain-containing protein